MFISKDQGQPAGRLSSLSLALQGGGSFGAFTWGVLDRLLEAAVPLDAISGASAGAMNAVLVAAGLAEGGPALARQKLNRFWQRVSQGAKLGRLFDAGSTWRERLGLGSPFGIAPTTLNPLGPLLDELVDFERLRAAEPLRLLIAATRVRDGRLQLFREREVTRDMVLASACLPALQQAVMVDREAYWDGGFAANPPLRDLARATQAGDLLLVQILPEGGHAVPHLPADVARRVNDLAFTAPLQRELEALEDLRACGQLAELRFHRIAAPDVVKDLVHESALDARWGLLSRLRDAGRDAADEWLKTVSSDVV